MSQKLRIAIVSVPEGPWFSLAARLEAAGAEVHAIPADATSIELPAGWVPDGLVTIPAEHQRARFDQLDLDRWDETASHELDTRFRIGQAVARRMLEADGGSIVHLVAAEGLPGLVEAGSAASLGYAVAGLSRGIALDLRDKVRSNTILADPDAASLDAVAALIVYLCGPQGRTISGQVAAVSPTRLQLFAQSRPLRVAHCDGRWDEAGLAAQMDRWSAYLPRLAETGEARK